jgi:uncharacterized protein (TIGR01244 family)
MSVESILNFIRIDERIGTGGQPTREQLEAARDAGYQAVINLAPDNADNHALPCEAAWVAALGLSYHHIPVEWTKPEAAQFHAFEAAMRNTRHQKVLIHCAANFRVTAFFALYAMRHVGWSADQADALIDRIWRSRPDYTMDATWKAFIADIRGTQA